MVSDTEFLEVNREHVTSHEMCAVYLGMQENQRLLRKLMNIADSKNVDHIKPWGARSSLSYKQGFNYDPISSQTYIDNIQFQRSPSAPPGQQSKYQKEMRELDIAREVGPWKRGKIQQRRNKIPLNLPTQQPRCLLLHYSMLMCCHTTST